MDSTRVRTSGGVGSTPRFFPATAWPARTLLFGRLPHRFPNELFLWKNEEQVSELPEERVKEELADVFAYAFLISEKYNFNVKEIVLEKIRKNHSKYPVDSSRNSAKKYNELK